jgi:hypothetical protein
MYVKTPCPHCHESSFHNLKIASLETKHFSDIQAASTFTIKNITVSDSLTEEAFLNIISTWLTKNEQTNLSAQKLKTVLVDLFGIAEAVALETAEKTI